MCNRAQAVSRLEEMPFNSVSAVSGTLGVPGLEGASNVELLDWDTK